MTLFRSFDASIPPASAYPGCQAVLGYLGGRTPHVWTAGEWQRFGHLRQAGIWVPDLTKNPRQEAIDAADAAHALGWTRFAAHRRFIVRDMETSVDPAWSMAFDGKLTLEGYLAVDYGSASVAEKNPASAYWLASWNDLPELDGPVLGVQLEAGIAWQSTSVDLSVWDSTAFRHFGAGPRK